ncbi:acyl transferase 15-like [Panicum virgatum]|uniref:Uncharacterized protein n=1 Tax=Panicum virgatum TaxID=38727 RepID=A0A8T0UBW1_PANVG|nr:acyl transferase 15-like [Panicum virgatum]KAG2621551.1 hypothetical protein PVAP13_3NG254400 [Panicum virgatum]
MSVAVRKSSPAVIRPPEPVTTTRSGAGAIKLTPFDWPFVGVPFTVLLVFEHLSHEAVEGVRRALSQALVHYYPFAGRICSSGAGYDGFGIRCTGEGVEFVTGSVVCGLTEANIFGELSGAKALFDELAVYYPVGSYGSDDPLLSVQVTEFSCGGVVLGATWNHAVADGAGIAQFLAAVGELTRGQPSPLILPARCDNAVSRLPMLSNPIVEAVLACPESPDMELIVPLELTVPSALIDRVKAEYRSCSDDDGQPCTTFEAVLAVLWQCRVRATMPPGSGTTPVLLSFSADIRGYAGARAGYYGNCVANQPLAAATSGAVASASLVDLVGMVRRAKARLPDKLKEELGSGRLFAGGRYDMLHVSSWRNIGFEGVDFGGGPPARVMYHSRWVGPPTVPTCMVYPPCRGKDGVNMLSIAVKEEHAEAFLGELAWHT